MARDPNQTRPPIGVHLSTDIESLSDRRRPFRARVRWTDPDTGQRRSLSQSCTTYELAEAWVDTMQRAASGGVDPLTATMSLGDYGNANMVLALRGLEDKTLDPYMAGWRKRVVPTLGHIPVRMISNGAVDRAVHSWIADGHSLSTIKSSLAILVRVMEQAVRDGLIDRNPARVTRWQYEFKQAEDELDDPRSLALPNWDALTKLAEALVAHSHREYRGWGDVVIFAACTAARIGEVSGCRVRDIDTSTWEWTIRRQTTTAPGGLVDKRTKGKRARVVPIIEEVRELVGRRIGETDGDPDARLFTGPRGGRIVTAVLREATHWDDVVSKLGYEHLRRHDLRHTGLTWMADAGVPVHHLRKIAGHASLTTTQRYIHPDRRSVAPTPHQARSTDRSGLRAMTTDRQASPQVAHEPRLHRGWSTTTLNAATAHPEDDRRSADCYQPNGQVHLTLKHANQHDPLVEGPEFQVSPVDGLARQLDDDQVQKLIERPPRGMQTPSHQDSQRSLETAAGSRRWPSTGQPEADRWPRRRSTSSDSSRPAPSSTAPTHSCTSRRSRCYRPNPVRRSKSSKSRACSASSTAAPRQRGQLPHQLRGSGYTAGHRPGIPQH